MKILIYYATTQGQTRKVCAFIADRLRALGDEVALVEAGAGGDKSAPDLAAPDLNAYDGAILAASIHVALYQKPVVEFARAHAARLSAMPSAFVSVSLSCVDSDKEERISLATIVEGFKAYTGWRNVEVHHVAGAIRAGAYNFFTGWLVRLLAWDKKLKLKPGQDLELTDWPALAAAADSLHARFAAAAAAKPR